MSVPKTNPTAIKSIPKTEVAAISEDKIAEQLIESPFPDVIELIAAPDVIPAPKVEVEPDVIPAPKVEVEPDVIPSPKVEIESDVINDFYESLGFPYCKKCGERRRTYDGVNAFCPIAKPNCSGFSA